jgi:predicted patatin/cPLA2 family phospholipase
VHEVLRVIEERARSGSRPGHRDDGLRIALSIEGGGMRGTVSAGMALALYERGLLPAFDAVYGSSAGAISGAWLVSSDPEGLRGWADPNYARSLIHWSAPLRRRPRRRPVVDVETLIEVLYQTEFPMDFASILASPIEYHPLATDAATGESTDLRPLISDAAELRLALRASASLPFLAGPPIQLHEHRFYDAGVAESIPFRTPLAQGATHILVLRSRRPLDAADGPAGADEEAEILEQAEIIEQTEADLEAEADIEAEVDEDIEADDQAEADEETEADPLAEADRRADADRQAEAAGAPSPADSPALRPPRPPRSVRLLNRTTLRRESPEFRAALLARAARGIADAEDMAHRQAAGQAFTVFPPAWTPPVSRLTTEGAVLTAALVAGREAVNILFDDQEEQDDQDDQDEQDEQDG